MIYKPACFITFLSINNIKNTYKRLFSSGEYLGGGGEAEKYGLLVNDKWFKLGFLLRQYFS
jgi:hypothetical protein